MSTLVVAPTWYTVTGYETAPHSPILTTNELPATSNYMRGPNCHYDDYLLLATIYYDDDYYYYSYYYSYYSSNSQLGIGATEENTHTHTKHL